MNFVSIHLMCNNARISHFYIRSELNVGLHKHISVGVNDLAAMFRYVLKTPNNNFYRLMLCTKLLQACILRVRYMDSI
jgi:hypothetical protein